MFTIVYHLFVGDIRDGIPLKSLSELTIASPLGPRTEIDPRVDARGDHGLGGARRPGLKKWWLHQEKM